MIVCLKQIRQRKFSNERLGNGETPVTEVSKRDFKVASVINTADKLLKEGWYAFIDPIGVVIQSTHCEEMVHQFMRGRSNTTLKIHNDHIFAQAHVVTIAGVRRSDLLAESLIAVGVIE